MYQAATSASSDWEEASACDVCGSTAWHPAGAICQRRYGRCAACGVVRLVDRVAESSLGLLYGTYYEPRPLSRNELERQLRNPTFAHRKKRIESVRGSLDRHLFEIGCGDGNFLAFMQRAGWTVWGSEFSARTAALIEQRHGIAVTHADTMIQMPPAAPYAVVAAYHVIEHVYRPTEWLRHVRTLVAPGGLLHLQTPNWDSLTHRSSGMAWSSMTFPQHVYFFSPHTLSNRLRQSGFEVLSVATWDPWHGPGTAAGSLGARAKQLATGRLSWSASMEQTTATADVGVRQHRRSFARMMSKSLLRIAGESVSRVEALFGRGGVVDVMARRVD